MHQLRASIPLTSIKHIHQVENDQLQLLTPERLYELKAPTQADRDLWGGSLGLLTKEP